MASRRAYRSTPVSQEPEFEATLGHQTSLPLSLETQGLNQFLEINLVSFVWLEEAEKKKKARCGCAGGLEMGKCVCVYTILYKSLRH